MPEYGRALFFMRPADRSRLTLECLRFMERSGPLIPLYLKDYYRDRPHFRKTAAVMTVHNLGYQGLFNKSDIRDTGLGWEYFTIDKVEFHDMLNYLKAGLI